MPTNGDHLRNIAEQQGIPLRTLADVKAALKAAKRKNADASLARLMLRHGRLTNEAILYLGDTYPSVWEE